MDGEDGRQTAASGGITVQYSRGGGGVARRAGRAFVAMCEQRYLFTGAAIARDEPDRHRRVLRPPGMDAHRRASRATATLALQLRAGIARSTQQ